MRTTRKLLALLLAVAMVFTMTAITALATGGDDGTTTPDGGTPTTPDGGTPTTPDGGAPTTPDGGTPTTPDGGAPTTPDGGAPTTPDGGTPTTPDGGTPTTPDGGASTTPDTPAPPEVSEQVQTVINLIAALPDFNTLGSAEAVEAFKAKVSEARVAYNELTLEQQAKVTNYETLTLAEETLALLELRSPLGDGDVCEIGSKGYPTLQAAVDAVQDGVPTTIKMLENVAITGEITIPKNKNITLDMAGFTITPATGFAAGRAFENKGTFTIKGNGTIDMTGAGANGYGTVNNFGRLTVEDGKYIGHVDANASNFYNRNGGTAIFINPEINGGAVCIATEIKTTTEIRGGIYTDELYPAIENRGKMTITGGTFKNTSCSSCSSNWGYTIRSGESAENAYLKIQGTTENSVRVTGVQGGLAIIGGTADIYNGFYETIHCVKSKDHNNSSYYAGYFTGESYETSTNIHGGTFKSYSRTAVLIGNSNEPPDSGAGEKSTVMIYGGEFIGGDTGKTAITVEEDTDNAKGAAKIFGGTFSSDVEKYLAENLETKRDDNGNYVVGDAAAVAKIGDETYPSLAEALKDAESGDTVTLLKSITVNKWNQAWNLKGITLDGDGNTITVNDIESLQNHDAVFHSAGGNIFKDLIVDLSGITQPSQAQGNRAFAAAAGDTFKNVTIKGSDMVSYGITISGTKASDETVTIEDCTIKNCHYAIYDSETGDVEKLIIKKSTITGCDYAPILHSPHGQFINNKVTGGRLNIMKENQTITNNTFDGASRIKFYNAPKEFKQNKILEDSRLNYDIGLDDTVDVSENYWGGGAPTDSQLGNDGSNTIFSGADVYYVQPIWRPEYLNTYTPPSGGGGGSGSYLPVILSPVRNQTVSVIEHGTLTMSVWASWASSYQWYVDRGDGRFVAIAGATGDSLTIWPDMGDNGNRYYCRATNGYGGVNSPYFTLCVVRSTLPPKTGDQVSVTLWVCLMALGVAGVLAAWNRQKNR